MAVTHRVVVTGTGWITPLGHNVEEVWQRLLDGHSGVGSTTLFDASTFPTQFSAEVKAFDLADHIGSHAERHSSASRNSQLAIAAAEHAWQQAGLRQWTALNPARVGVYLGGGEGPVDFENFAAAAVAGQLSAVEKGQSAMDAAAWGAVAAKRLDAMREFEQEPNLAAAHIAVEYNAAGPNLNTLTACAASTQAIGEATLIIQRGDADVMFAGGTHSMIHPLGVTGFNRLTALSTRNDDPQHASRPFDRARDGFVLGEGAGMIILESLDHAVERGANILGEIVGYGSTADAFRVTDIHEDGRGPVAAMRQALTAAGMTPADIDYVSAHGTGTSENDKIETLSIRQVFGDRAKNVSVSSIKSMLGHLIAAAGVVELIVCIHAIRDSVAPPTANYQTPDPLCELDYVPNEPRKMKIRAALSNSFGFGGQNDALIVTAPPSA